MGIANTVRELMRHFRSRDIGLSNVNVVPFGDRSNEQLEITLDQPIVEDEGKRILEILPQILEIVINTYFPNNMYVFCLSHSPDPYDQAQHRANTGRDPRPMLEQLRNPCSELDFVNYDNIATSPLAGQFIDSVLRETAQLLQKNYTLSEIATVLSEEQKDKLNEIMGNAFERFIRVQYDKNQHREERILRSYDHNKEGYNIPKLLDKAKVSARAGNVDKTVKILDVADCNSASDWTNKIFNVYRKAHQTNFNRNIKKAERAFVNGKHKSGMNYLYKAEGHAREIEIDFKVEKEGIVEKYLNVKAFNAYQLHGVRGQLVSAMDARVQLLS